MLTDFCFAVIVAICIWSAITVAGDRFNFISFPFLFSASIVAFLGPQYLYVRDKSLVPASSLETLALIVMLSLLFSIFGWHGYKSIKTKQKNYSLAAYNIRLIDLNLYIISIIGAAASFYLRSISVSVTQSSQWTGLPVIINFFASANTYAFIFSMSMFLLTKNRKYIFICALTFLFVFDRVFILFRRETAVMVFLGAFVALWVFRRWRPSVITLLSAIVVGGLLINFAGAYRATTFEYDEHSRTVMLDNWVERFISNATESGGSKDQFDSPFKAPELKAAVYSIEAIDQQGKIALGASFWNKIIQDFVPSNIFGVQTHKDDLKIAVERYDASELGFNRTTGSTATGFVELYWNFGIAGSALLFFVARFLRGVFERARNGDVVSVLVLAAGTTEAMKIATHTFSGFLSEMLYLCILLAPILFSMRQNSVNSRVQKRYSRHDSAS